MKELKKVVYYLSFPLSFIGFFFPLYVRSLGAELLEIGLLFSVFSLTSILVRPLVGQLIDRRGRKLGIILGLVLYVLVYWIYSRSKELIYFLPARILQSMAASFVWTSVDTMVADTSDGSNRGEHFGWLDQTASRGQMLGLMLGFSLLMTRPGVEGFRLVFLAYGLISFYALAYAIKYLPETREIKEELEPGKIKDKKKILLFLVLIFLTSWISSLTSAVYLIYLQELLHLDPFSLGYLFLPSAILYMLLARRLGSWSDRRSREDAIVLALLFFGFLELVLPRIRSYYGFMILYSLTSLVSMFYGPALTSLVMDFVGEDRRGRSYGNYHLASGLGLVLGPLLGAAIYSSLGGAWVFYLKGISFLGLGLICHQQFKKNQLALVRPSQLGGHNHEAGN